MRHSIQNCRAVIIVIEVLVPFSKELYRAVGLLQE